ncbi:hypothetical protein QTG54_005530 [Skeletonema marinoi]|uniref:Uncharacterized protein n=1 Tax=Skeletonema marinoi TaxID=267567 RepID=A0AAD8YCY2_9STRA|nr:hypothetical protein QTG54_005530 [Skeletonema marinoi]
MERRGSFQS